MQLPVRSIKTHSKPIDGTFLGIRLRRRCRTLQWYSFKCFRFHDVRTNAAKPSLTLQLCNALALSDNFEKKFCVTAPGCVYLSDTLWAWLH